MRNDTVKKLAELVDEISFYCCFVFAFTIGFIGGLGYFLAFIISLVVNISSSHYLEKISNKDRRWIWKYAIYLRFLTVIFCSYLYFKFVY
ncbi:MAG: hypothetical protein EA390_09565 [Balneolaceae bacterium]|nr:MAG: hypothetical protein EA390_09565 [Balneolaceae bacterium]